MRSLFAALIILAAAPFNAMADEPTEITEPKPVAPPAPTTPLPASTISEYANPAKASTGDDVSAYVVPRSVPYEGGAIPSYAHIERKANFAVVGTGIGVFSASYIVSLIYGLTTCGAQMQCRQGSAWLYLPLAGPFITAAQAPTTGGSALAAFDGGVQVLGAVLTVVGFAVPRKYVTWQTKTATFSVTPSAMANTPSLAPRASFENGMGDGTGFLGPSKASASAGVGLTITSF